MGLGKTLTAITHSLLSPRPSYDTVHGSRGFPTLILTSKAVFPEWVRNGFQKFFDPKRVRVLFFDKDYMSPDKMQTISRLDIVNYDFVVVTYDTLAAVCKKGKFHECILEYVVYLFKRRSSGAKGTRSNPPAGTTWQEKFLKFMHELVLNQTTLELLVLGYFSRHHGSESLLMSQLVLQTTRPKLISTSWHFMVDSNIVSLVHLLLTGNQIFGHNFDFVGKQKPNLWFGFKSEETMKY